MVSERANLGWAESQNRCYLQRNQWLIRGLHAERSLWTTASKRTELQGEWNARPTSIKPTEVSRTRTTLAGYQRVSTGLARPIQTCLLGGSSLVRISAPPELMSRK